MNDEMKTEAMELCVTACEKFSANNEVNVTSNMQSITLKCREMKVYNSYWKVYKH